MTVADSARMGSLADGPQCPLPRSRYEHIVLGHGGGGQLTADLISRVFLPRIDPCLPCGVHMYLGAGRTLEERHIPMLGVQK